MQRSSGGAQSAPRRRRFRPEQQRFAGIEVPVFAVTLRREEERPETSLPVHEGLHAGGQLGQRRQKLLPRRALEDCQGGEGGGAELGPGLLHDGAAPAADVLEIAVQVETQIAARRLAQFRAAAKLRQLREGARREEAANGVVGRRVLSPARPVLVGQGAVGGEIAGHPPADAVGQIGGPVLAGRWRRVDHGPAAKQLHRGALAVARQQELAGGKGA